MDRDPQKDLELCERATPGPWFLEPPLCGPDGQGVYNEDGGCICEAGDPYPRGDNHPQENMTFIAAAREALPYWIRRAEEFREKYNAAALQLEAMREHDRLRLAKELEAELGTSDPREGVKRVREMKADNAALVELFKRLWVAHWNVDDRLAQDIYNAAITEVRFHPGTVLLEELERLKADNAALRDKAGAMSRALQAGVISDAEYERALIELEEALSQSHPGSATSIREELNKC